MVMGMLSPNFGRRISGLAAVVYELRTLREAVTAKSA
jgi:hypothetical protein